ncbi:xylulokinase [Paraburkholderia fynbosensis]|uniref:Xylulose kinase n=1 Tax=Paraburkholderia fynbosensis TaxID=1200993 RepID=A0A6J5GL06_9BURK|nr:xylulokinase [Paraburkholderia fynbosensis]CAB3802801.1 Xylulose kinase [Paraburkholderia fynbosensis]
MTFLGIDLGTSEVKALLTDDESRMTATGSARLEVEKIHPHWSEQSPQAWWNATLDAIAQVRASHPAGFAALRGIGLSGQMHGATLLDRAGQVLRPAILWNDTRAFAECVELEALVPESRSITGNLAMPGFTAPKLLWLSKYEPAVFHAVHKVLLPKDYVAWRLTGEFVSDMSDASGTLWLDVAKRDWSDRMLCATGLSREHMPRLVEGSEAAAQLNDTLRREWGIATPVLLCGGAGDNAASAIGMGVTDAGSAFLSLGTSGVLFAGTDRFAPNPAQAVHAFCHCLPGRWHQMSVILSAASSLAWLSNVLKKDVSELAGLAEKADGRGAPLFLPYLGGERTPHNDANAKGVFWGLTSIHGEADLAYSVMEGVAFAMADGYAALQDAGTTLDIASFIGGGSRSRFWATLCATATGVSMRRHHGGDVGGALGAARLARLAVTKENVTQVCTSPATIEVCEPDAAQRSVAADRLGRYRRIYAALKNEFSR